MRYFVHTETDDQGQHQVHAARCPWLPAPTRCTELGDFDNCVPAVLAAKRIYRRCNGCVHCCRPCHTR